jgi:two-component system, cell cycle sensor histidine kinase and response regulator CckA
MVAVSLLMPLTSTLFGYESKMTESIPQIGPLGGLSVSDHAVSSVLVMDDDSFIRDLATFVLEYLGYNVRTCINGEEAIERYINAKESGTPHLTVIMDLSIPDGMGGKDAAQQILRFDPNARLIVSSGYSDDPVMSDHGSYGFYASLPKPYKVSDVAKVLTTLRSL